jgi:TonB family protein
MTYFDNQADTQQQSVHRRRQANSPWLWLALVGGSVAIHLVAIHWVKAATLQAQLNAPTETATPIDFVELPADLVDLDKSSDSDRSRPQPPPPLPPRAAKPPATPVKPSAKPVPASQPAASVQPASDSHDSPVVSAADIADVEKSIPAEEPAAPRLEQAIQPAPASPTPSPSANPVVEPEFSRVSPLPTPTASPLITTQRIDVPIPDVTETLPLPAEAPEDLSAVGTNQVTIPSHLTASLTTDSLPAEDNQPELDETAQPKTEVQTFSSNPSMSPCLVTPEAVQFLGKTVAMQVVTDETGKVVDTVTQESSESREYDELATCLVKNWSFEPAIARGEPVANDGLVVRITIDRS